MKRITLVAAAFFLLASAASRATESTSPASSTSSAEAGKTSQMVVSVGSRPSTKGPNEYFTGDVRVSPLFSANASTPMSGAYVTFAPGARSAWHQHPTGQHLIVTVGTGWTQEWGGPVTEIREGDVVWCPPGIKHWHGASPTEGMTHIALTGTVDGKNVEWMEKVNDEQYNNR